MNAHRCFNQFYFKAEDSIIRMGRSKKSKKKNCRKIMVGVATKGGKTEIDEEDTEVFFHGSANSFKMMEYSTEDGKVKIKRKRHKIHFGDPVRQKQAKNAQGDQGGSRSATKSEDPESSALQSANGPGEKRSSRFIVTLVTSHRDFKEEFHPLDTVKSLKSFLEREGQESVELVDLDGQVLEDAIQIKNIKLGEGNTIIVKNTVAASSACSSMQKV